MLTSEIVSIREQSSVTVQRMMAGENFDLVIAGALLLAVVTLTLSSIWRTRRRAAAVTTTALTAASSSVSLITRWLTPTGTNSIAADRPTAVSVRRRSGSHRSIRVPTPVSKVPQRALKEGADALAIARKSGLSRDGVAMMIATAMPRSVAKPVAKPMVAMVAASAPAAARQVSRVSQENAGRAMSAPGAYTQAQRAVTAKVERAGVGTYFSARLG
jgi:hypothetical protein